MLPDDTIIVRPSYTPKEPDYRIDVALRSELLLRIYSSLISEEEREYYRANVGKWQTDSAEMERRDQVTKNRIAYRSLPEPVRVQKLSPTNLKNIA